MKREVIYAMDGSPVTRLIPENKEDMQEIYHLAEAGKLDARESFGDDPAAWERSQQRGVEPTQKVYVVVNGVHRLQDAPSDNN